MRRYYDRDKDGQLTIKELRQGLQNTDLNIENYLGADADGARAASMLRAWCARGVRTLRGACMPRACCARQARCPT